MKQQYEEILEFIEAQGEVETYSIMRHMGLTHERTTELLEDMNKVGLIKSKAAKLRVGQRNIGTTRVWRKG